MVIRVKNMSGNWSVWLLLGMFTSQCAVVTSAVTAHNVSADYDEQAIEYEYYAEGFDEDHYNIQSHLQHPVWSGDQIVGKASAIHNISAIPTISSNLQRRRELAKRIRLHNIKHQILERLGMSARPNLTSEPPCPDKLRADISALLSPLVEDNSEERTLYTAHRDYLAKSLYTIQPVCELPYKTDKTWQNELHDNLRLYFEICNHGFHDEKRKRINSAVLRIYKTPLQAHGLKSKHKQKWSSEEEDTRLRITVYQYLRPVRHGRKEKKTLVSTLVINKDYEGWMKLDLKSALDSWIEKPKKNYGILVVAEDSDGKVIKPQHIFTRENCVHKQHSAAPALGLPVSLSMLTAHNNTRPPPHTPTLDVISVLTATRRRRAAKSPLRKPTCHRHEIYVKFEELAWSDWIIQPLGFPYATCQGSCSRLPRDSYFNRRIAPSTRNHFKPVVHACCGPTKVKPLQILHFDENKNIMLSIFEDFLISECGCNSRP